MKGAQVGGTEIGLNWLGYIVDIDPAPILVVQPTTELARRFSIQRIKPLFDKTQAIKDALSLSEESFTDQSLMKSFPNGILAITSSLSLANLRSMPMKYLFLDEVDAYLDSEDEGDVVDIAEARTRSFASSKKIFRNSTPLLEKTSKINSYFKSENAVQCVFKIPCPFCRSFQEIKFENLKWEEGKPKTVKLVCINCNEEIEERYKPKFLNDGDWFDKNGNRIDLDNLADGKDEISFHISSFYSPLGWFSWQDAVKQWEQILKSNSEAKKKAFRNTIEGLPYSPKVKKLPEWERLYERRSNYLSGSIPSKDILYLTCGIDVQGNRLEAEVIGHTKDFHQYSIEYRIFYGDIFDKKVWQELSNFIHKRYKYEAEDTEATIGISKVAIDANFETTTVLAWCRSQSQNHVMPIRGDDKLDSHLASPKKVEYNQRGERLRSSLKIWRVGVSVLKNEFFGWLGLKIDENGEIPNGYCFFPHDYPIEYFKQLTAEELVLAKLRGRTVYKYEQKRKRNEALDTRIYNRAASYAAGLDRYTDQDWEDLKESIFMVPEYEQEEYEEEEDYFTRLHRERRKDSFGTYIPW
jgi:phage terminase large subunit GpA-like protein